MPSTRLIGVQHGCAPDLSSTPDSVQAVAHLWDVTARRTLVVRSGAPADVWYGVRSGMVALVHESGPGAQGTVLDVLEPGQWFGGDVALAAETVLASSLFVVRRADMLHLAERDAAVRGWLLDSATERTLRVAQRLRVMASAEPGQRVRWAIALLVERFGYASQGMRALAAALPQAQLARVAGTSRQTVNRTLMDLRRRGALHMHQGRIVCAHPFPFTTS